MESLERASFFSGTGTLDRPVSGDSSGTTSLRLDRARGTSAVYDDSQIVKALFVALRTAVPQDVRLELLHTSADELKFLIAAQPRVSSFSHRRRHSLRHPALAMATKRFYFRHRERQAAYEQYLQEQQQQKQQELAAQQNRAISLSASPKQDGLDVDDSSSPWSPHATSPGSMDATRSMSFTSKRGTASTTANAATAGRGAGRRQGRKDKGINRSGVATPQKDATSNRASRSASVSFADYNASGLSPNDGPLSTSGSRTAMTAVMHGTSDDTDWCDFSMSVSNALWNYRRPSQHSVHRLQSGGGSLNASNTFSSMLSGMNSEGAGAARRHHSFTSASSFASSHSVFGAFNTAVPALRVLEADRYQGMKRANSISGLGGRAKLGFALRTSVRSLLSGGMMVRGPLSGPFDVSDTGDDDDDDDGNRSVGLLGSSLMNLSGNRGRRGQGRGSSSAPGSDPLADVGGGSPAVGLDTAEEREYRLYQQLEDARWDQIGFCYDLLLRTSQSLTTKAALAAAGDALVNDVIRRYWERITISPAAEDIDRQERLKSSKTGGPTSSEAGGEGAGVGSAGYGNASGQSNGGPVAAPSTKRATKSGAASSTKAGAASSALTASKRVKKKGARKPTGQTTKPNDQKTAAPSTEVSRTAPAQPTMPADDERQSGEHAVLEDGAMEATTDVSEAARPTSATGTRAKKKKKRKSTVTTTLPNVAAYMTPLQYIYLNMRIAQVLLPQRRELEVEMLESVQEDLMVDAAYEPRAASARTSYSGVENASREAIHGRSSSEDRPRRSRQDSAVGHGNDFGPPPQWLLSRGEPLLLSGRAFAKERGGVIVDHQARLARQHRNSSRTGEDSDDNLSISDTDPNNRSQLSNSAAGVVAPWNPDRLPSIHYAQFWLSMLELADNWTCTAGNSVDMYIFLMELYGEVFGHDWDDEDEQLVKAMRTTSTSARNTAREAALVQNMQDALDSFHDLVKELDDLTSTSSASRSSSRDGDGHSDGVGGSDGDDGDDLFLRKKRRRHAKRREKRHQREGGVSGSDEDESANAKSGKAGKARRGVNGDDDEEDEEDDANYKWRYVERVGEDGSVRYFRRRVQYTKSRRRQQREAEALARGDNADELSEHDSDLSVYMIEEELTRERRVLHRRRARCHVTEEVRRRVQARRRRQRRAKMRDDDAFMYEPTGPNLDFRRRKFFDSRPRKKRKLENDCWGEDYDMDEDLSEMTSWSSFNDEDGSKNDRTAGDRRGRTRHTGTRRDKRRYGRRPGFYYDLSESGDEGSDGSDDGLDDDDVLDNVSEMSLSVVSDAAVKPKKRRGEPGAEQLPLTDDEREELRRKKKWLQETLAERGIHIADETFTDVNEEPLLYELLQMTERLMRRKRAKNASGTDADNTNADEADDIGIADFDAALLAKLFAKPKQYTLDELQQSALMEKLLRMGEELGADQMPLSSTQLDDVLAALLMTGGGRAVETTSMRLRRERLIREARQLREEMKRAERARRRQEREAEEQRLRDEAEKEKDTFDLTGVPGLEGEGRPSSSGARGGSAGSGKPHTPSNGRRSPSTGNIEDDGDRPFTGMTTSSLRVPSAPPSRPGHGSIRPGSSRASGGGGGQGSLYQKDEDYDAYFQLHPLTAAQRKEQERLFNEFDAFTAAEASEGGKYKVTFTAYTPEQFEAFYRHLHLGPQQRALLRGRAPLAPPTSVQGGTYHQLPTLNNNRNVGVRYGFSLGSAQVRKQYVWSDTADKADAVVPAFKPAPVKLFTLTTKDTLNDAIEENFSNYLDDRAYKESLLRVQATAHATVGASALSRPPSSGGAGDSAASPPASTSATLLPFSPSRSSMGSRRDVAHAGPTHSSPAEPARLPRIGVGFRHSPQPSSASSETAHK